MKPNSQANTPANNGGQILEIQLAAIVVITAALASIMTIDDPAFAADCRSSPAPGIDWQDCRKRNLILAGSNLRSARLARADFTSSDLRRTTLGSADFTKSYLVRAMFDQSTAPKANFENSLGYRTSFVGADLEGANFEGAEMQRADFSGASLINVRFEKSELGRVNFAGADITGANFAHANLARTDFRQAIFNGPLVFKGAHLFLTQFEGVDLSDAIGLAQWQIDMSCGNEGTKLPHDLLPGPDWPCEADN